MNIKVAAHVKALLWYYTVRYFRSDNFLLPLQQVCTCVYIHFNQNVDEKSDISAKLKQENIYTQFFC